MKVIGITGARLHLVHTKKAARARKQAGSALKVPSWMDMVARAQGQVGNTLSAETAQQQSYRMARVEELRARVKLGIYRVDSIALARCILLNETHFFSQGSK